MWSLTCRSRASRGRRRCLWLWPPRNWSLAWCLHGLVVISSHWRCTKQACGAILDEVWRTACRGRAFFHPGYGYWRSFLQSAERFLVLCLTGVFVQTASLRLASVSLAALSPSFTADAKTLSLAFSDFNPSQNSKANTMRQPLLFIKCWKYHDLCNDTSKKQQI